MNYPGNTTPQNPDDLELTVKKILLLLNNGVPSGGGSASGITIPASDYVAYAYYGSTNNIQTAVYKSGGSGGTTVATLTFTYVGGGASNDDNVATITKS